MEKSSGKDYSKQGIILNDMFRNPECFKKEELWPSFLKHYRFLPLPTAGGCRSELAWLGERGFQGWKICSEKNPQSDSI